MKFEPIGQHDLASITEADLAPASGVPPMEARTGRRGDEPFQPTPGGASGMQSTGITGNLLGLPFDPATQGVTGMHGETGDPLAREIESGLVANGPAMLLGKGLRYGAEKLLASKGGQAADLLTRAAGQSAPAEGEVMAARKAADQLRAQLGDAADAVAAKSPPVREILELPGQLEARAADVGGVPGAQETLKPHIMPSPHALVAPFIGHGIGHGGGGYGAAYLAAEMLGKNAAPVAGRLAAPARAMVNSPPMTPLQLFMAAQAARIPAGAATGSQ